MGALSALVTAAAHTFGGGMFPSEAAMVLLCVVCAGIGCAASVLPVFALARIQLMLTLAVAQFAGHVVLTVVDGHHHGPVLSNQMLVAHAAAVVAGAVAIYGAERGIRRAVSSVRRILPMLASLVVHEWRIAPPLPVYRVPGPSRILDLSGAGNRGPPAILA